MSEWMLRAPSGFAHWLSAATFILGELQEVAIAGEVGEDDTEALLDVVTSTYRPNVVVAVGLGGERVALLRERPLRHNRATATSAAALSANNPSRSRKRWLIS